MKIEYDAERDLLYLYFANRATKSARCETIIPGIHIDFDRDGKIIGMEILDAHALIDGKIELKLPEVVKSKI